MSQKDVFRALGQPQYGRQNQIVPMNNFTSPEYGAARIYNPNQTGNYRGIEFNPERQYFNKTDQDKLGITYQQWL